VGVQAANRVIRGRARPCQHFRPGDADTYRHGRIASAAAQPDYLSFGRVVGL